MEVNNKSNPTLDSAEWDFPEKLSGPELTACFLYEYARESNTLRKLAAKVKELKQEGEWCPQFTLRGKTITYSDFLLKKSKLESFLKSCSDAEAKKYEHFLERVDKYKTARSQAVEELFKRCEIESSCYSSNIRFIVTQDYFPNTPWQQLRKEDRDSIIRYPVTARSLAPANLSALEDVCDAIPQCKEEQIPKKNTPAAFMWPGFSCHPYVVKNGMETRPFKIDWAGSANKEICEEFCQWVSHRRKELGIDPPMRRQMRRSVNPPGRGFTDKDLKSHLYKLGIMRLLNACHITLIHKYYPKAWKRIVTNEVKGTGANSDTKLYIDYPEAFLKGDPFPEGAIMTFRRILNERRRYPVRDILNKLFPFNEDPIHWPLS